eukprot:scaffold294859_cov43-Prasinocladus_malaysianus.AAC.1
MAGDGGAAGSTAVMPIKKRKYEKRASIEAARGSLEMQRPLAAPRIGTGSRRSIDRGSFESRRSSVDHRRPSMEFRVSLDRRRGSLEVEARPMQRTESGQTATIQELNDDIEMSPIAETSGEEVQEDDGGNGDDDASNGVFQMRLLSKIFTLAGGASKPSCVKVKGQDTDGYIVNQRFMDVVKRRQQKQEAELQRLQNENAALRDANKNLGQKYMSMANWQTATTQQYHPQSYVYSSLYAAEHQRAMHPQPTFQWQQEQRPQPSLNFQ